jgi:protein-disulfide isomerase
LKRKAEVLMRLTLSVLAFAALTAPVQAFDIANMTPEEKAAFGIAVREYLIEHPDVLLEVIDVIEAQRAEARANADKDLVAANSGLIFGNPDDFVGGNPDGDVTLVEFLDYRCGYCKQAHPEVADLIKADGNVRFVIKEFPILGEQSVLAARFALAVKLVAGDEAYGTMHDKMMTLRGDFTEATLRRLSDDAGLPTDEVMARMNDAKVNEILNANHKLAEELQIDGTPGFVLGDQLLRGYVPPDAMEEFLKRARS